VDAAEKGLEPAPAGKEKRAEGPANRSDRGTRCGDGRRGRYDRVSLARQVFSYLIRERGPASVAAVLLPDA
jgi:hypothetical protein